MSVIFISHSGHDDAHASALLAWLKANGFDQTFIDHDTLTGGEKWREALKAAAQACRVVICLVTPNWLSSFECFGEFTAAWYMGRRIVPLFMLPAVDDIDEQARQRLARVQGEDQGIDCSACICPGGSLNIDRDPAVAKKLADGLKAAGANTRVGLDPQAFSIDRKLRGHPFPGLSSFGDEDADAALFYGRSREIAATLVDLRKIRADGDRRPLVILGASGAGKSSLLKAGIIPRLRRERPAWLPIRAFRPGAEPLLSVAEALQKTLADYGQREAVGVIRDRLLATWRSAERRPTQSRLPAADKNEEAKHDGRTLSNGAEARAPELTDAGRAALAAVLEAEGARLRQAANLPTATILISVDQAEEMARADSESAEALADYLRTALTSRTSAWQLAFTIRTDSFGELQTHPRFNELEIRSYDLRSIPVFRFTDVVEEPAKRYGVAVDIELVDRLMAEAPKEDALPLLAFALQRLWQQYAETGRLTEAHYNNVGGINGLISDAAERAMRGLDENAALPSRSLSERFDRLGAATFVPALAQINEQGATIRRVARWRDFEGEARELLDRFEGWRLVRKIGEGEEATIEVAHEALLREWGRLRGWLEPERVRLEMLRTLHADAAAWDRAERDVQLLHHRDVRLREVEALSQRKDYTRQIGDRERAYLSACRLVQSQHDVKARRGKALVAVLAVLLAAIGFGWWQQDWVYENYHVGLIMRAKALTGAQENALRPGDEMWECARGCPVMVVVPGGSFLMGSAETEEGRGHDEAQHEVAIRRPFAVGKFEVTFAEWGHCVAVGACPKLSEYGFRTRIINAGMPGPAGSEPVANVSWHDANQYTVWLSRITGKPYRLLSEAEWEYAARAGSHSVYAWGDNIEATQEQEHCAGCNPFEFLLDNAKVGSFPANAFGLFDMHGNVAEWVEDCYFHDYAKAPADGSSYGSTICNDRVVRGASLLVRRHSGAGIRGSRLDLRSARRQQMPPDSRDAKLGFRLARPLPPSQAVSGEGPTGAVRDF